MVSETLGSPEPGSSSRLAFAPKLLTLHFTRQCFCLLLRLGGAFITLKSARATGIYKLSRLLKRTTFFAPESALSWVLFQDKLVVDCFSQLQVLNRALVIREHLPVFGECGWQEDINRLQVVASEWNVKKSLLQAWGLILRANILDGVNLGNIFWYLVY